MTMLIVSISQFHMRIEQLHKVLQSSSFILQMVVLRTIKGLELVALIISRKAMNCCSCASSMLSFTTGMSALTLNIGEGKPSSAGNTISSGVPSKSASSKYSKMMS